MHTARSVIVETYCPDPDNYSDLKVLSSGAGFYVGTVHTDPEFGFDEPGSRDSDYFPDAESAAAFLDEIVRTGDRSRLRQHP